MLDIGTAQEFPLLQHQSLTPLVRDCSLHNIVTSSGVSRLNKRHREELVERSMLPHGPATAYYYSLPSPSLQVGLHEPTDDADATSQPQYYLTGMDYWIFMTRATARWGGFWTSGYCSRDLSPPEYDETQFRNAYPVLTNWEHRQTYNPFWLDVFLIGTMRRKDFVEVRLLLKDTQPESVLINTNRKFRTWTSSTC